MNYYLSPVWVYIYGLVDNVSACALGVIITSVIIMIVAAIVYFVSFYEQKTETAKSAAVWLKRSVAVAAVACVVNMLIPSQDTLIYMQVAKFSTPENVETVVETMKNTVDYVVGTIKELKTE